MVKKQRVFKMIDTKECNSNNHFELAPFKDTVHGLIVDSRWWSSIDSAQQKIISEQNEFKFGYIDGEQKITDRFMKFYKSFMYTYNYDVWFPALKDYLPKNTFIYNLSLKDRKILAELSKIRILTEKSTSLLPGIRSLSDDFYNNAKNQLSLGPMFIKLSTEKNDRKLKPIKYFPQLINYICDIKQASFDFSQDGPQNLSIVFIPWNKNLNPSREFRVFVYNGKITAISQQLWFKKVGLTEEKYKPIVDSIIDWFNKTLLPYKNAVLDVWCDEITTHLIELNPFFAWSSSGSSLFHWINDYKLLHDETTITCAFN